MNRPFMTYLGLLFLMIARFGHGQEQPESDAELVQEAENPVSTLTSLPFLNDFNFGVGSYNRTGYLLNILPVRLTAQAGQSWRVRSISIIPVIYQPEASQPQGGSFGLGDISLSATILPRKARRFLWAVGPIVTFPTATAAELGSGKWSAGPAVVALARPPGWMVALFLFNVWSFAGSSERSAVNAFRLQYIVNHNLKNGWYFASSPIVTANWKLAAGEQWLVPVGGGIGRISRVGSRRVSWQVQMFYNVIHPRTRPYADWTLRLQLQLLFLKKK